MADSDKKRHQIYTATGGAGAALLFTLHGEAGTRKEALRLRQNARGGLEKNKQPGTVYMYTDGKLDKIGVHK